MIQYLAYGVLIGFTIGYPLGLWASWYTYKEVKKSVYGEE
jgi:ABC-type nitrate/sulfonate/bicarbonate transport system permease component